MNWCEHVFDASRGEPTPRRFPSAAESLAVDDDPPVCPVGNLLATFQNLNLEGDLAAIALGDRGCSYDLAANLRCFDVVQFGVNAYRRLPIR